LNIACIISVQSHFLVTGRELNQHFNILLFKNNGINIDNGKTIKTQS